MGGNCRKLGVKFGEAPEVGSAFCRFVPVFGKFCIGQIKSAVKKPVFCDLHSGNLAFLPFFTLHHQSAPYSFWEICRNISVLCQCDGEEGIVFC